MLTVASSEIPFFGGVFWGRQQIGRIGKERSLIGSMRREGNYAFFSFFFSFSFFG